MGIIWLTSLFCFFFFFLSYFLPFPFTMRPYPSLTKKYPTYAAYFIPLFTQWSHFSIFLYFDLSNLLPPYLSLCFSLYHLYTHIYSLSGRISFTLASVHSLSHPCTHSGPCKIFQWYLHLMLNGWAERRCPVSSLVLAVHFEITFLCLSSAANGKL